VPSHPPSEPRPRTAATLADGAHDRPARAQLIALVVLGFVLVAVPLYLWRRPRMVPPPAADEATSASLSDLPQAATKTDAGADSGFLRLSEPVVLECHDPGPKKTQSDQCGHLPELEKSFARAIGDSATCVPTSARPATLVFVADVSYGRPKNRAILVSLGKGGSIKNARVASGCESSVEQSLKSAPLDGEHSHARYKIQITATYP